MTTVGGARAELVVALVAAGVQGVTAPLAEPPYAYVTREGIEPSRIVAGQVDVGFTIRLVAGAFDSAAAADQLDADLQTTLRVLRELAGWSVGSTGPDVGRDYQGATYLTADVATSRRVDIA